LKEDMEKSKQTNKRSKKEEREQERNVLGRVADKQTPREK
jgi:hypothetical protein